MLFRRELIFVFSLLFLSTAGISSVDYSNEKLSFCNSSNINDYLNEKQIDEISINIDNYRKWTKNYLEIIKSGKEIIPLKYKKKYKADIAVVFENELECTFPAKIRISGDLIDHIESEKIPLSSLDVELLNGNINSITRFKLLIPDSRNNDNEIFIAKLMNHLGLLSPETFYVKTKFNGIQYKYIFQEKPSKEFLERNHLRESIILKGNERHAFQENSFNSRYVMSRPENPNWVKKNKQSFIISKKAIGTMNHAFLKNINISQNYIPSERDLDLKILSNDNPYAISANQKYMALMYAMHAEHGLVINNRRFYYDPIYDYFLPIYYDGNANVLDAKFLQNFDDPEYFDLILRHDGDGIYVNRQPISSNEVIGAISALDSFNNLNVNSFTDELNMAGLKISKDRVSQIIQAIRYNLERVSQVKPYEKNFKYHQNFIDLNNNIIEIVFDTSEDFNAIACNFQLNLCHELELDLNQYAKLLSGNLKNQKGVEYLYIGQGIENYKTGQNIPKDKRQKFHIDNELKFDFFGEMDFKVDKLNKKIYISQQGTELGRVLIKKSKIDGWNIKFTGLSDINFSQSGRFDENLLTGCLTIVDSEISNLSIELENSFCEDGLNLIRSKGTIDNLAIKNSLHDALDVDFSNLHIKNVDIIEAGNDCIDLSGGENHFSDLSISDCGDKAISLGEKSKSTFEMVTINDSQVGLEIKDSSLSTLNNISIKNTLLCINAFNKKQEFWGGFVKLSDMDCDSNQVNQQLGSKIIEIYEL